MKNIVRISAYFCVLLGSFAVTEGYSQQNSHVSLGVVLHPIQTIDVGEYKNSDPAMSDTAMLDLQLRQSPEFTMSAFGKVEAEVYVATLINRSSADLPLMSMRIEGESIRVGSPNNRVIESYALRNTNKDVLSGVVPNTYEESILLYSILAR